MAGHLAELSGESLQLERQPARCGAACSTCLVSSRAALQLVPLLLAPVQRLESSCEAATAEPSEIEGDADLLLFRRREVGEVVYA